MSTLDDRREADRERVALLRSLVLEALDECRLTVTDELDAAAGTGTSSRSEFARCIRLDATSAAGHHHAVRVRLAPCVGGDVVAPDRVWTSWHRTTRTASAVTRPVVRYALGFHADDSPPALEDESGPVTNDDVRLVLAARASAPLRDLFPDGVGVYEVEDLLGGLRVPGRVADVLRSDEPGREALERARPVLAALASGAPLEWALRRFSPVVAR